MASGVTHRSNLPVALFSIQVPTLRRLFPRVLWIPGTKIQLFRLKGAVFISRNGSTF